MSGAAIDSGLFRNPNMGPVVGGSKFKVDSSENWVGPRDDNWWSGLHPTKCPGFTKEGFVTCLGHPNFDTCTRQELIDYFDNAWTLTDILFASLQGEEAFMRPPYHGLRHPMIFYYGHTAVVYINKCRVAGLIKEPIDAYMETIMETGVDEMSWDDMSKNEMEWPSVASVLEYRKTSYKLLKELLNKAELPIKMNSPGWAVGMGVEHEHIHLETSSCLLREMPLQFLRTPEYWAPIHPSAFDAATNTRNVPNEMIHVAAGNVELGKDADFPSFGWDNEYGHRHVHVPAFKASKNKITNGEFLAFVIGGGYRDSQFWSTEGWAWRRYRNAKWPTWWVPDGPAGLHKYKLRNLFDVVDLPLSWPACVNCHEAKAYANWLSKKENAFVPYRITTEAEHHRMRDVAKPTVEQDPGMLLDGPQVAQKFGFNLALAYSSEVPVDALGANKKGFTDVMGNVWEWCEDDFNPLEGFKVHPYYDDFSVPCFDGKHNIIMGGSFISAGELASYYARYHFRPHFFQHAGFRLVQPEDPSSLARIRGTVTAFSQATAALHASALVQLGASAAEIFPQVPPQLLANIDTSMHLSKRCAELLVQEAQKLNVPLTKALDLDMGAGGGLLALSSHVKEVVGASRNAGTADFVNGALKNGYAEVQRCDEGDLQSLVRINIEGATATAEKSQIVYLQDWASTEALGEFNVVMSVETVDKVGSPADMLNAVKNRVAAGGLLLVSSSFLWDEKVTPKGSWLGGQYDRQGHRLDALDALNQVLGDKFTLIHQSQLPTVSLVSASSCKFSVAKTFIYRRSEQ